MAENAKKQQFLKDRARLRKAVQSGIDKKPNTDRINLGTYVDGFEEDRTIDVDEGMRGLQEAENELKRESSRGGEAAKRDTSLRGKLREMTGMKKGGKVKKYAEGKEVKTDFPDQSAEARKKRMEMPADKYGKMVDKTMGVSKGGKKGDFNEEPDMGSVKKAKGGMVKSSASKRADGCCVKGKTKGRMV